MGLWRRCFPVNFVKILRAPFLQNTSGQLLLYSHKREEKWRQILDVYIICAKISFILLTNFASPEKWSTQGICSPSSSPKFTLLHVTSTRQQFSLLARRKYETILAKRAGLPLERCPTTSPYVSTAAAHLSYWFSGSGRALKISPYLGVHFVM